MENVWLALAKRATVQAAVILARALETLRVAEQERIENDPH